MDYTAVLRGLNFRPEEARVVAKQLPDGASLTLQREPDNRFDPNAVQVIEPESQMFIGYVAKEVAVHLAAQMDNGEEAFCTVESNFQGNIVLAISTKLPEPQAD